MNSKKKDKEYWKKYNQTPGRKEYQKKLMAYKRVQFKNETSEPKESRHGKYRDPDYHQKYMREKRDWEDGFPVSRPYSQVSVIDVYPNGKFARPREKESFLMKKINSAQAGEILVPDNN